MIKPVKRIKKVYVNGKSLLDLIHWARRYADRRCTRIPNEFNRVYDEIMEKNSFLKEHEFHDETLTDNGLYFPYAKEGDFDNISAKCQSRCY